MPTSNEPQTVKLGSINQIGFVVRDIDKVTRSWSTMFGLGPWDFRDVSAEDAKGRSFKVRIAHALLGSIEIELVQPVAGRGIHADFLESNGEGLQHINVHVKDVDGEVAKLVAQGARVMLSEPGFVTYVGDLPGGLILELSVPRPPSLPSAGQTREMK